MTVAVADLLTVVIRRVAFANSIYGLVPSGPVAVRSRRARDRQRAGSSALLTADTNEVRNALGDQLLDFGGLEAKRGIVAARQRVQWHRTVSGKIHGQQCIEVRIVADAERRDSGA